MNHQVDLVLKSLQKEYVLVGKTRVKSFQAWLVIGLAVGITAGVVLVASRSGEFEKGRAAVGSYPGIVYATDYVTGGDGKSSATGWTGWENAINAVAPTSTGGGGTVYFPTGIYKVTKPVYLPRYVKLEGPLGYQGEGLQSNGFRNKGAVIYNEMDNIPSFIVTEGARDPMFPNGPPAAGSVEIKGLTFEGPYFGNTTCTKYQGSTSTTFIPGAKGPHILLEDAHVSISDSAFRGKENAIVIANFVGYDTLIEKNAFADQWGDSILLKGNTTIYIRNNWFTKVNGLDLNKNVSYPLDNCTAYEGRAISGNSYNVTITDNIFDSIINKGRGIAVYIVTSRAVILFGNYFEHVRSGVWSGGKDTGDPNTSAVFIGNEVHGVQITGNNFGSTDSVVEIYNNSGTRNIVIASNDWDTFRWNTVKIGNDAQNVTILGVPSGSVSGTGKNYYIAFNDGTVLSDLKQQNMLVSQTTNNTNFQNSDTPGLMVRSPDLGGVLGFEPGHSIFFRVGQDGKLNTDDYHAVYTHRFYTGDSGLTTQQEKMRIDNSGDVFINTSGQGLVLRSSTGKCFRLTVNDSGSFSPQGQSVTCPTIGTTYAQSTYYAQSSYATYAQSMYYAQSTYYAQSSYYAQSVYYAESAYYAESSYSSPHSSCAAVPNGLAACWKFDETTGTMANDSSGRGNHGFVSAPTWIPGQVNGALQFDGSTTGVSVSNSSSLTMPSSFSISVWINPAAVQSDWTTILAKEEDSTGSKNYALYQLPGTYLDSEHVNLHFTFFDARCSWDFINDFFVRGVAINKWNHVALTYNGASVGVYLNGIVQGTPVAANYPGPVCQSPQNVVIGKHFRAQLPFPGKMDEVGIYNRVLTASEISQLAR